MIDLRSRGPIDASRLLTAGLLLAGCASAPTQEPVGRVEYRTERAETFDVLAVSVPVATSQAVDRITKAFESQQIERGSVEPGLVHGSASPLEVEELDRRARDRAGALN